MAITIPGTSEPIGSVDYATNAGHATTADTATSATTAGHATTAGSANTATNAGHATTADKATSATSATNATNATNANIASYLDWKESFQSRHIIKEKVSDNFAVTNTTRFGGYVNINKTGYTPIALFGYLVTDIGMMAATVEQVYITDNFGRVYISGKFSESFTGTYKVEVHILYVKTS